MWVDTIFIVLISVCTALFGEGKIKLYLAIYKFNYEIFDAF